jgi:PAS domain S-box-containing protein
MPASIPVIRILIIDDDEDDYFITSEYLSNIEGKSFVVDWCYKYNDALKNIKTDMHDVYLIDYRLGAKTGIDLIKEAIALKSDKPFILLTGKGDINIDVEAMKLGAFDYLIKAELSSEKLERSIRYSIDRSETLREIRTKEKRYRNIFDKSGDAIFVADKDFYFTEVNYAFCELLNCDKNAIGKIRLFDILPNIQVSKKLEDTLEKEDSIEDFEADVQYMNGEVHRCVFSATKEKDLEGIVYYQGILHDITFIRKAEKATLQAEKLAAAGRLVKTLAHEVRNPINNINLAVEQLYSFPSDEEEKLYLDIVYRNSNRINELITELLSSSKPTEMQFSETDLKSIIDEVINNANDRIKLKNIQLEINYPEEKIMLLSDAQKMIIAFSNILINAVEAIDHANGKISITVQKFKNMVAIQIEDNGHGINAENLSRLFEPYFTSKRNGIGLGLASTLNIIQSHNGAVDVNSQINHGTVFTVSLPLQQ